MTVSVYYFPSFSTISQRYSMRPAKSLLMGTLGDDTSQWNPGFTDLVIGGADESDSYTTLYIPTYM